MKAQTIRKNEAEKRNTAWAKLSPKEQLTEINKRLGVGVGAAKQRKKIQALIDAGVTAPKVEVKAEEKVEKINRPKIKAKERHKKEQKKK